ncbi:MAG: HAD-IC family P-type ATPase [Bacilli bacterium]
MKYTNRETGLSSAEVKQRIDLNQVNTIDEDKSKSYLNIIKDNVLTLFNLLNLLIGIALFSVQAYSNMFYLLIIIMNILIGIIQEIKAKHLVEKLSITSASKVEVLRDAKIIAIDPNQLVLDDIMILKASNQILSDAIVVSDVLEVDESLLSGESDLILKEVNSKLLSGSFVISGQAQAQVIHVGIDNYASNLVNQVSDLTINNSRLAKAMKLITKFTSFFIIPTGILLFIQAYYFRDSNLNLAVVASSAALLGMLPKGLMLLISISGATGVIKLAQENVLVQEMQCIETLAYVDVLCLDKTGTITKGEMSVIDYQANQSYLTNEVFKEKLSLYLKYSVDNNATFNALNDYFKEDVEDEVIGKIAFSSQRKWGSITFKNNDTLILGAAEFLLKETQIPSLIKDAQNNGARGLILASSTNFKDENNLGDVNYLGSIILDDPIKENTKETLDYFKNEGVAIKIISGDNVKSVSQIALKAGFLDYDSFVDLSNVADEDIPPLALKYSIFGRVNPKQKQLLVRALKEAHYTVGMSGDGVNDILALKEADCSIAMSSGNDAIKQISQIVLLDSDLTKLPMVLSEGRRIVNNISNVASIFFIKTISTIILTILCLIFSIAFPFIPTQITLIDLVIEGYPSFFLSFESNNNKVKQPFLKTALLKALPNALAVIFNIIVITLIYQRLNLSYNQSITMMYYLLGFCSILSVVKACYPFNKLRIFLVSTLVIGFYSAVYLFSSFLHLQPLNNLMIQVILLLALCSSVLVFSLHKLINKKR